MSYGDQLRRIVEDYQRAGEPWPATAREIAAWAVRQGLWRPQPGDLMTQCAHEIAGALREEYITDAQGRRVRAKHAATLKRNGKQATLWADIRSAPRAHMEVAFQQRRNLILGDCKQLKADADSYNDNMTPDNPIQTSFDFTEDLEEWEIGA